MANLKDLLVNGASRFIGDIFGNKAQLTTLNAPTAAGGTTYGAGSNGNVLRSNGTSLYWGAVGSAVGYNINDGTTDQLAYYSDSTTISPTPHITRAGYNITITGDSSNGAAFKVTNGTYTVGLRQTAGGDRGLYENSSTSWLLRWQNNSTLAELSSGGLYVNSEASTQTAAAELKVKGRVVVDPWYHNTNNFSAFRINRSSTGWSDITLGGARGTLSGSGLGTWLIAAKATPADATTAAASITDSQFYISYNGSNNATCRLQGHNADGFSVRPRLAVNADVNTTYNLHINGTSNFTDQAIFRGTNAIRFVSGNYGLFMCNEASTFSIMVTESGAAESGSCTTARPLVVNKDSGVCNINGCATFASKANLITTANSLTYFTDTTGTFGYADLIKYTNNNPSSNNFASPILQITGGTNTIASGEYIHHVQLLANNLADGANLTALSFGKAVSSRNAGNICFHYAGSNSNSSYISLGLTNVADIVKIYGDRVTALTGGLSETPWIKLYDTTPAIQFHYGSSSTYTNRLVAEAAGRLALLSIGTSTADYTYNNRTVKSILRINGIMNADHNIESARSLVSNSTSLYDGVFIQQNGQNYGMLYTLAIGTAGTYTNNAGTPGTIGKGYLVVGNNISATPSSSTDLGENNAQGVLRVYGPGTRYIDITTENTSGNVTQNLIYSNGNIPVIDTPVRTTSTQGGSWTFNSFNIQTSTTFSTSDYYLPMSNQNGKMYLSDVIRTSARFYNNTTSQGFAGLLLGNDIAFGTAGAAYGYIYLYTNGTAGINIKATNGAPVSGADTVNYLDISTGSIKTTNLWATGKVWGGVYNDYAEFRKTDEKLEPGRCVKENGDDSLSLTNKRLERGCEIVSDTFGFAIGETENAKTPVATTGRVLAYPYESREEFASHIGWPVCSGPDGTVSIMTEEEEEKYPSRIIGTISAVPDYEEWGDDKVKVNGRVWIRIR